MGVGDSHIHYTAELEERIVELESNMMILEQKINRIGKEKRTGYVGWVMYAILGSVALDIALGLLVLLKH